MKIQKINKKAAIGEGVFNLYRLALVTFIAFIILGVSAVFYDYYIDVRDAEAGILAKDVFNCIAPKGILNIPETAKNNLLDYCEIKNNERFYVLVNVYDKDNILRKYEQGDSSVSWVLDLINAGQGGETLKKYKPGFFNQDYYVLDNNIQRKIEIKIIIQPENT